MIAAMIAEMKLRTNVRLAIPLLIQEGGCAIKKKMRSIVN